MNKNCTSMWSDISCIIHWNFWFFKKACSWQSETVHKPGIEPGSFILHANALPRSYLDDTKLSTFHSYLLASMQPHQTIKKLPWVTKVLSCTAVAALSTNKSENCYACCRLGSSLVEHWRVISITLVRSHPWTPFHVCLLSDYFF